MRKMEFFFINGRAYYDVEADSPEEALAKAETYFDADDFGDLTITGSKLKHIRLDNRYWYPEDLYEKPSVDVYTELVKDLYELAEDGKGEEEDDKVVTMLQVAASIIDTLNVKLELAEKELAEKSAENSQWTPCSEKLPKAGRFYNVTVFDGEDDYRVEPAFYAAIRYSGQPNVQPKWWTDMADTATLIEKGTDKVVAWQPLPEPYLPKEMERNEDEAENNIPRMTM